MIKSLSSVSSYYLACTNMTCFRSLNSMKRARYTKSDPETQLITVTMIVITKGGPFCLGWNLESMFAHIFL